MNLHEHYEWRCYSEKSRFLSRDILFQLLTIFFLDDLFTIPFFYIFDKSLLINPLMNTR